MTDYTSEVPDLAEAVRATTGTASAPPVDPAYLMAQAAQAEAAARELRAQATQLAKAIEDSRKPQMPNVNEGPQVVTFSRYMGGREYNYAAVGWRVGRAVRWSVTGQSESRFNWPALLAFIGEADWPSLCLVTDRMVIGPAEGTEPAVVEHMGRYGRVVDTTKLARDPFGNQDVDGSGQYGL